VKRAKRNKATGTTIAVVVVHRKCRPAAAPAQKGNGKECHGIDASVLVMSFPGAHSMIGRTMARDRNKFNGPGLRSCH